MRPAFRLALSAGLLCLGACQRSPDTDSAAPPPAARGAAASAAAEAKPAPAPGSVTGVASARGGDYACSDGTRLQAAFGEHDATLRWSDGRSLTLPRAESASKGGGDVYVGDTVSLQRDGTRLQLHDAERAVTDCAPADAGDATGDDTIADHYACDAGVRLGRKDDGSFRAEIPGNPPVRLARIDGSRPPVFAGASLYLRIEGSGEAILSQGDRTNELRCTPGQAPA